MLVTKGEVEISSPPLKLFSDDTKNVWRIWNDRMEYSIKRCRSNYEY